MNKIFQKYKDDYRHIICTTAALVSAAVGHFFPNSIPRLLESIRDLFTSVLYYIVEIFSRKTNMVYPTVVQRQEWQFAPEVWKPIKFLPASFDEFLIFWVNYWSLVFNITYFKAYLQLLYDGMFYLTRFMMVLLPLVLLLYLEINNIKNEHCTDRNKKSKPLVIFEKFLFNIVHPAIAWCRALVYFLIDNSYYLVVLFIIWGMHFNLFSIFVSALAYYFYFTSSWNLLGIYTQLLKLQTDLTPVIRFFPGIVWIVVAFLILVKCSHNYAEDQIYYFKRCNTAFLRGRGISTIFSGKMGMGKTKLMTGVALLLQEMIFNDMYDVMIKYDHYFPNFPWIKLIDDLRSKIDNHKIVDLISARKYANGLRQRFCYITKNYDIGEYEAYCEKHKSLNPEILFGYDFLSYAVEYNNALRVIDIFDAIEEYACAYYTFTIKTTLLFANYSIRSDSVLLDNGNMPFRDNSIFSRDVFNQDKYSRFAHIIEMDMLRLGRKMVSNNERARTLLPGIYVQSEKDKERKNTLELKEIKSNVDEANQKNDLQNATEMMSRHANTVDYKSLVYHLADLQREDALGAGSRDLAEVITIVEKSDMEPVLPFYSPFWIYDVVFKFIRNHWISFYRSYIINRSDQTLLVYLAKNIYSFMANYHEKIVNTYGVQKLTLQIKNGEAVSVDYWRSCAILELSNRYSTDCLKGVFEPAVPNKMHIDDYEMYKGIIATPEELGKQHSYFQNDIKKMKG